MNLQVAQYADEVGNNKVASNEVDQCLRYPFAVTLAYSIPQQYLWKLQSL